MLQQIKVDFMKLVFGMLATIIASMLLMTWRIFDTSTFLFIQIIVCCLSLYILLILLSRRFKLPRGKELVATLIAFTLLNFTMLNIDRSRSFYLLKWVGQYQGTSGVSIATIAKEKSLTASEMVAIQQRVQEQKQSIMLTGDVKNLRLSGIGRAFTAFCNLLAQIFKLQGFIKA